ELCLKNRVGFGLFVDAFEFEERDHERFGDVAAAVRAEASGDGGRDGELRDHGRIIVAHRRRCGESAKMATSDLFHGGESAVGTGYFSEEVAEFGGVFDAGAEFDAAGDVDGVGTDGEDSFADVFRREAAGEDDFVFCGGPLRN